MCKDGHLILVPELDLFVPHLLAARFRTLSALIRSPLHDWESFVVDVTRVSLILLV